MKKEKHIPHSTLLLLALLSAIAPAQESTDIVTRFQKYQHTQELLLAQKGQPYFICDLTEGRIELKTKGIVLRKWNTDYTCLSGDPFRPDPVNLLAREAASLPQREHIKPGEPPAPAMTRSGRFRLTSYELEDMPDRYSLFFSGQVELKICSTEKDRKTGLQRFFHALTREMTIPLRTVLSRLKGRHYTRIDCALPMADDARALFWACSDKTPWIIVVSLR